MDEGGNGKEGIYNNKDINNTDLNNNITTSEGFMNSIEVYKSSKKKRQAVRIIIIKLMLTLIILKNLNLIIFLLENIIMILMEKKLLGWE